MLIKYNTKGHLINYKNEVRMRKMNHFLPHSNSDVAKSSFLSGLHTYTYLYVYVCIHVFLMKEYMWGPEDLGQG